MKQLQSFFLVLLLTLSVASAKVAVCLKDGLCILESGHQILCPAVPKYERFLLDVVGVGDEELDVRGMWRFGSSDHRVASMRTNQRVSDESMHLVMRSENSRKMKCRYFSKSDLRFDTHLQNIGTTVRGPSLCGSGMVKIEVIEGKLYRCCR